MLYGAESWVFNDQKTWRHFDTAIMTLYRRLLGIPADAHITDLDLLAKVMMPNPQELLARVRLRYLGTLFACRAHVPWGLLRADAAWRDVILDDLRWLWLPAATFQTQMFPPISGETSFSITPGTGIVLSRMLVIMRFFRGRISAFSPCFIATSCSTWSRWGILHADHHEDKTHLPVTFLDAWPVDASANRRQGRAHLRYYAPCRQHLATLPRGHQIAPGQGSKANDILEERCDRSLPILQAAGPCREERPCAPFLDIHFALEESVLTFLLEEACDSDVVARLVAVVQQHEVSWTQMQQTLQYIMETYSEAAAEGFCAWTVEQVHSCLRAVCHSDWWPFLTATTSSSSSSSTASTLQDYEQWCIESSVRGRPVSRSLVPSENEVSFFMRFQAAVGQVICSGLSSTWSRPTPSAAIFNSMSSHLTSS
eukprot:Skav217727  [mRNA]  locus=scaffold1282:32892:35634:+ [translate_table: standard]